MPKPQQPELRRSGLGSTDQDAAELRADDQLPEGDDIGPVPEANQPGHHPAKEQDKPDRPQRR
jgi:hypothetical protein